MRNTHTHVNKPASVACILFGFLEYFQHRSIKFLEYFQHQSIKYFQHQSIDAQIKEYNTELSKTPNTYDES